VVAAAAVIGALGYLPTRSFGREGAVTAMVAALAVAALGSIIGGLPIVLAGRGAGERRPQAVLVSMAVRLLAVVVLAALTALAFDLALTPLLVWLALGYLLLLVLDTLYAMSALREP
jgi:hypothetical protein